MHWWRNPTFLSPAIVAHPCRNCGTHQPAGHRDSGDYGTRSTRAEADWFDSPAPRTRKPTASVFGATDAEVQKVQVSADLSEYSRKIIVEAAKVPCSTARSTLITTAEIDADKLLLARFDEVDRATAADRLNWPPTCP